MKIVTEFPRKIREIENYWIPMSDGCRLAARIWLPEDAEENPVPAVLEYLPYRKRDFLRARDEPIHSYFAGHGYAAIRLDLRGSGDSEGLMFDEYLKQEHDDAVEAVAWLAAQPWCSGSVGYFGKSWGGFNGLQIAARRPPELKAIITYASSGDRYENDVHYMGGCNLAENLEWGSILFSYLPRPPDPAIVGERWRDMWRDRLENTVVPLHGWLSHQRRDAFWKHGSVCENYDQIQCAVYAITGWTDGYSNSVFEMVSKLNAPCKGLIGPWGHLYAQDGYPGPAIGFLQEAVRWWDHWLKGIDTGIMDEPKLRVWMQDSIPPSRDYAIRPGRWVAEEKWPSPRVIQTRYALNPGEMGQKASKETLLQVCSSQATGLGNIHWGQYGTDADAQNPGDQREDDAQSLVFDTAPLDAPVEILGAPTASLEIASNRPVAFAILRLNDVASDGASTLVSFGILNLTHRNGHERPEALQPGQRYRANIQLNEIAHAFPIGHRIRLAVSTCSWPMIWPAPEPVTLSLYSGSSVVDLPVRPASAEDDTLKPFGEPEAGPPLRLSILSGGAQISQTVERNLNTGETVWEEKGGPFSRSVHSRIESTGAKLGHRTHRRYTIRDNDPLAARSEIQETVELGRDDWQVRIKTITVLSATKNDWLLEAELEAYEGGDAAVFSRKWDYRIPRDHM